MFDACRCLGRGCVRIGRLPGKEDRQPVEDEAPDSYIDAEEGNGHHKFLPGGDLPFGHFPIKGYESGIQTVEHYAKDSEKSAEADQSHHLVPDAVGKEDQWQEDPDPHL